MWYQTIPSVIVAEQWSWDWTVYTSPVPLYVPYVIYKRVGDAVLLTYPNGPMVVAYRDGQSLTWMWKSGAFMHGGPTFENLVMFNGTVSITFTDEDIPLINDDNDYKGLRLLAEMFVDQYELENFGGDNYLWHGTVHQHFICWAPKGSRA